MSIPLTDLNAQLANIREEIDEAIKRVMDSGWFVNGPEKAAFEVAFAQSLGARFAIGVGNGTDALALALTAAGIGPGDSVALPANTFVATAEAVRMIGAKVVLVDVDLATLQMSPAELGSLPSSVRAVVPVHLYGYPAPIDRIVDLATNRGLIVIEDAAQAFGAKVNDRPVGTFGAAGAFSFFPAKTFGAYGDGGAVVTKDGGIATMVRGMANHGRSKPPVLGRNSRLDEIQAAMLSVKLRRFEAWAKRRKEIDTIYRERFADLDELQLLRPVQGAEPVPIYTVVRFAARDRLKEHLEINGVDSKAHYDVPLHRDPVLADLGYNPGDFPVAEKAAETVLSLPCYPEMTEAQVETVVEAMRSFFKK
jgi:dTDP-4-amino-4,6-dideoxygalactose transaminase